MDSAAGARQHCQTPTRPGGSWPPDLSGGRSFILSAMRRAERIIEDVHTRVDIRGRRCFHAVEDVAAASAWWFCVLFDGDYAMSDVRCKLGEDRGHGRSLHTPSADPGNSLPP